MTDKKKKPVESALKKDVDAAIDAAAVEIVAENITTKAVEKLKTEGEKKLPAVAEKVLKEAKKKIADFESADASFEGGRGFTFKRKSLEDQIATEAETIELSQVWDENILTQDRLGAVVTIGSKTLMPVGEVIKSSSLGRGFSPVLPDVSWQIKSALNKLTESVELYRYVFRLGTSTFVLYLSEDSSFHISNEFYGYHGPVSTSVIIGISATLRDVSATDGNIVVKYDVEKTHLRDAILLNIDPDIDRKYQGYENCKPSTDYWCSNNWSEDRRYSVKSASVNDTQIINSDIEYGHYNKSNINRCILLSGSKSISIINSRLNTFEVNAVKRINISNSRLSGNISGSSSVNIEGLKTNDISIQDAPVGIDIKSQFGWTRVDWMNDTSVRFFTGTNNKLLVSIPHPFVKEHDRPWAVVNIRWEDYELQKERPGSLGYGFNFNQLNLASQMSFRRNGKVLERPDMIQRAFVEFLEGAIESRMRVLALIRSIADNASTVIPKRPDYYDEVPF